MATEICDACGEQYYPGQWYKCPHDWVIPTNASRSAPMIQYVNKATGEAHTPGQTNDGRAHAFLTSRGFERKEIHYGREYERWQRDERTRIAVAREQQAKQYEETVGAEKREKRGQLYQEISSMTPQGRAFAEEALRRAEVKDDARRRAIQKPAEPLNHAVEYSASNLPGV